MPYRRLKLPKTHQWIVDHINYPYDDCIKWPYSRNIQMNGYKIIAARFMCISAHGDPPTPTHQAAHSCGKGHLKCINPNHLSWKTPAENNHDRIGHGTTNDGEANGQSILTADSVIEIKCRLTAGETGAALAQLFGVSPMAISDIKRGATWRSI